MHDQQLNHQETTAPAPAVRMRPFLAFRALRQLSICALAMGVIVACGGGGPGASSSVAATPAVGASTAGVLCDYSSSVFNSSPSVNATATAAWTCSASKRVLNGNGLPDHPVGTFPNSGNPNPIAAQSVSSGPLRKTAAVISGCRPWAG